MFVFVCHQSSLPSTSCQCVSAAGPPDPPAGLRIVTVSALTAVLVWQPSAEHGTPATGYQLEYWLNGADTGARDSRKQVWVQVWVLVQVWVWVWVHQLLINLCLE